MSKFPKKIFCFILILCLLLCSGAQADTLSVPGTDRAVGVFVAAYEYLSEETVDARAISSALSIDPTLRKALELDLLTPEEAETVQQPLTGQALVHLTLSFRNTIRARLTGDLSRNATVGAVLDELGIAFFMAGMSDSMTAAASIDDMPSARLTVTRAMLARILVTAYRFYTGKSEDIDMPTLSDTNDSFCLAAAALGLMERYPADNSFEPNHPVQLRQMQGYIERLIARFPEAAQQICDARLRTCVGRLLLCYPGIERVEIRRETVSLDIARDWYVNQLHTGESSANNCLPACGEMLLTYLGVSGETSAAYLRAMSPHDGEGWYAVEFRSVMELLGVKLLPEYTLTADSLGEALDSGHLLVVMCSFDGAESGHAMVVYGYERGTDGLYFLCNDPLSEEADKYGHPCGKGRRIAATDLVYAIQRHVDHYFIVMENEI